MESQEFKFDGGFSGAQRYIRLIIEAGSQLNSGEKNQLAEAGMYVGWDEDPTSGIQEMFVRLCSIELQAQTTNVIAKLQPVYVSLSDEETGQLLAQNHIQHKQALLALGAQDSVSW